MKSASESFRFDCFTLDVADRRLRRDGEPVELTARYFDALALLVTEAGTLVSKDRFLEEVWRGIPVTDEALTQCIKALRRALGDEVARPRFIETVPKHGYRFIAPLEAATATRTNASGLSWRETFLLGAAGMIGAGFAGFIGGLIYGFAGASRPLQPGLGAISVLLVILCLTIAVALIGGAGVAFGIAIGRRLGGADWRWIVGGGATGGLVVGAVVKLLGVDAFNLLFGRSLTGMTGAMEGLLVGGGVGLGAWFAIRLGWRLRRGAGAAAFAGGLAGLLVPLLGGRLMGGSLDLLSRTFPESRLRLDQVGVIFSEQGFGLVSQLTTCALEGALFSGCLVGFMILGERTLGVSPSVEER
ncbi:MAG: transcriptional regulator [Sphingomicrobium sp.]